MLSNPQKAIEKATSRQKLAETLHELLKKDYPNSSVAGWLDWEVKYSNITTAKKCAWSMYKRIKGL